MKIDRKGKRENPNFGIHGKWRRFKRNQYTAEKETGLIVQSESRVTLTKKFENKLGKKICTVRLSWEEERDLGLAN